jgi:hypothetical protein
MTLRTAGAQRLQQLAQQQMAQWSTYDKCSMVGNSRNACTKALRGMQRPAQCSTAIHTSVCATGPIDS